MTHAVIQIDEAFKILRLSSMCAYGHFETREEAENAIRESCIADQEALSSAENY